MPTGAIEQQIGRDGMPSRPIDGTAIETLRRSAPAGRRRRVTTTLAPRRTSPYTTALPAPPAPSTTRRFALHPLFDLLGLADDSFEAVHRRAAIGVVTEPLCPVENDRVGRADAANGAVGLGQLLDDLLLVRNRDAQPVNVKPARVVDEPREVFPRHAKRNVDLVQLEVAEAHVVDQRAETVSDRIGHHSVDLWSRR